MIPKGLFIQIAMLILSGAIIITYVKPQFTAIKVVQNDIADYKTEREMVISVNAKLAMIKSRKDSIATTDLKSLDTYLPNKIDEVSVLRDLYLLSKEAGVVYVNSEYGETGQVELFINTTSDGAISNRDALPQAHTFNLAVEGTYGQIKNLVYLMSQNNYPLEIREMSIKQLEGGFLETTISIVTYTYNEPVIGQIIF